MPYLLIDIGNSRIKIAIGTEEGRTEKIVMSTGIVIEEPLDEFLLQYIISHNYSIGAIQTALVSSVVPEYNATILLACSRIGIQTLFITQDVLLPLETAFPIPPMVGVDRLLLAYGASILYPQQPSIIVSFGTATTFNLVNNNIFQGGPIFAGVMQSLHSLLQNASQLRTLFIDIQKKKENQEFQLPQTAESGILQGFTEGFASMTEGMLNKLSAHLSIAPCYIAAGGMAPIIASYTDIFTLVQEDLVLDALWYLSQREVTSSPRCTVS